MLESAYEALLAGLIQQAGYHVKRQVPVTMRYKGVVVDNAFRIDLLVERRLVVELKSIEKLAPVHGKQALTYLRLMNLGKATFKDGLKRVANDYRGPIG